MQLRFLLKLPLIKIFVIYNNIFLQLTLIVVRKKKIWKSWFDQCHFFEQ